MFGDKQFDLLCFLTLLVFCLIKKYYEILVKKNKTTQVVLFLQIGVSIIILVTFKFSMFSLLCLILLVFFSHIFIVDIEKYVIPYVSIFGILVLGIINLFVHNDLGVTIGERLISFTFFTLLWGILTIIQNKIKKDFLGGGDLMLFSIVSLFLGGRITVIGVFFASFIALIIHFFGKNKKREIPFGPYLVCGFLIALIICNYLFNFILKT